MKGSSAAVIPNVRISTCHYHQCLGPLKQPNVQVPDVWVSTLHINIWVLNVRVPNVISWTIYVSFFRPFIGKYMYHTLDHIWMIYWTIYWKSVDHTLDHLQQEEWQQRELLLCGCSEECCPTGLMPSCRKSINGNLMQTCQTFHF